MNMQKRSLRTTTLALGMILGLSACGNHGSQQLLAVAGGLAASLGGSAEVASDPRERLTASRVASLTQPFLLVSIPSRGAVATMTIFAQTPKMNDWRTADNSSLVMQGDIVVATRGLGADLFAADADGVQAAIKIGTGRITRAYRTLDGENRQSVDSFECTYERMGVAEIELIAGRTTALKVDETCTSNADNSRRFTNAYWLAIDAGQILQSRQWISHEIGFANLQQLKR